MKINASFKIFYKTVTLSTPLRLSTMCSLLIVFMHGVIKKMPDYESSSNLKDNFPPANASPIKNKGIFSFVHKGLTSYGFNTSQTKNVLDSV